MSNQIIVTISRQPGSGGLEIGQRLARKLSAVYIDKKTVARAAEGMDAAVIGEKEEPGTRAKFWDILAKTPILQDFESYIPEIRSVVSDSEVHEKEEEILLQLVGDGPTVVVGRGGFHRLRDKNAIHVFLAANREYRLHNYARLFGLPPEEADRLLASTDRATETYIHKVTGKDMFDLRNFDLVINVSTIDFNCAIELILDYIHDRSQYLEIENK